MRRVDVKGFSSLSASFQLLLVFFTLFSDRELCLKLILADINIWIFAAARNAKTFSLFNTALLLREIK